MLSLSRRPRTDFTLVSSQSSSSLEFSQACSVLLLLGFGLGLLPSLSFALSQLNFREESFKERTTAVEGQLLQKVPWTSQADGMGWDGMGWDRMLSLSLSS